MPGFIIFIYLFCRFYSTKHSDQSNHNCWHSFESEYHNVTCCFVSLHDCDPLQDGIRTRDACSTTTLYVGGLLTMLSAQTTCIFSIKFQHQNKFKCHILASICENRLSAFTAAKPIFICLSIDSMHKAICLISAEARVYNGTVSATVECTFKEWYCCAQGPSEI